MQTSEKRSNCPDETVLVVVVGFQDSEHHVPVYVRKQDSAKKGRSMSTLRRSRRMSVSATLADGTAHCSNSKDGESLGESETPKSAQNMTLDWR